MSSNSDRLFSVFLRIVATILISAFGIVIQAQDRFRFDAWTTDDGLPQNTVNSIAQTSNGYLWMTTFDGLARFDGVNFTVFNKSNSKNFPSNRLLTMVADGEDALWFLNDARGLTRYFSGTFQNISTNDGLPSNDILKMIIEPDGKILVFTASGLAKFDGIRFTAIDDKRDPRTFSIYYSTSKSRWEINAQSLIRRTKDGRETTFKLPTELQTAMPSGYDINYFVRLFEDNKGVLWFWLYGDEIYKLENERIEKVIGDVKSWNGVTTINQDAAGALWFGTGKRGACRFDQNRLECFDRKSGLASDFVRDIMVDQEKNLWIATNDSGIFRLSKQVITPFSTEQGLKFKNVYSVLQLPTGEIWLGSFGGIAKFYNGTTTNYSVEEGLIQNSVISLYQDRNSRLLIGSINGIYSFENNRFISQSKDFAGREVGYNTYQIYQDEQNVFWLATSIGLIRFEDKKTEIFTTENGLPTNEVRVILPDRTSRNGALWIGTYNGLARLENGIFTVYSESDNLAGNQIRTLFQEDDGTLWIGTYDSGLSRFKDGKFTNYNKETGLFSNGVFQILPDRRGNFWISSNQGIYRVSRAQLNEYADGKRQAVFSNSFGKSDGMINAECNGGSNPAGIVAADGKLWFPTQDGAAIIDPEAVISNPLPPPIVIETVKIENKTISTESESVEILPGQENLEINYTGISFIKPEEIRFRYRLEGLDEKWTEAANRRTAFYPYLPPGEYVFRVLAANSDNIWNEQGAALKIIVRPAFYQTYWFLALSLTAAAFLIAAIYRVRVTRLEKAQRAQEDFSRRLIGAHETERRRIAAELHDSIGQSLAMIKNRVIFNQMKSGDAEIKEQFELIAEQTSRTINEVREISYNLRPYLLERLGLTEALKSLLDDLADLEQFRVESEIDDLDNFFDGEMEMNLYRIMQECINNIVKHAAAKNVYVSIKNDNNNLNIIVKDDGKGFDIQSAAHDEQTRSGFGLIGINERVRMLGGQYTIESVPGNGTKIIIKISRQKRK